jgi:hypothetical protein
MSIKQDFYSEDEEDYSQEKFDTIYEEKSEEAVSRNVTKVNIFDTKKTSSKL